jgi:hypothetical protein
MKIEDRQTMTNVKQKDVQRWKLDEFRCSRKVNCSASYIQSI